MLTNFHFDSTPVFALILAGHPTWPGSSPGGETEALAQCICCRFPFSDNKNWSTSTPWSW